MVNVEPAIAAPLIYHINLLSDYVITFFLRLTTKIVIITAMNQVIIFNKKLPGKKLPDAVI